MKKIIFICTFIIILLNENSAFAQNLIPNPSFEVDTACPNITSKIYYARPWFQPLYFGGSTIAASTSDLFDTCGHSGLGGTGIPYNGFGYQNARTGKSYAGIFFSEDTVNYREYLEVPLDSTLIAGQPYCVSFYVSLADSSAEAISNLGAYFSADSLLDSRFYALAIDTITPQFENAYGNILSDTANWVQVQGSFVAAGGEKFMTIGNFHKPANTHTQSIPCVHPGSYKCLHPSAYYYVDDVSLVKCSGEGINELGIKNEEIGIYPNPTNGVFTISTRGSKIKEVRIFNVLGEEIITVTNTQTVDLTDYSKGIYFAEIKTVKGIVRKKVVKT